MHAPVIPSPPTYAEAQKLRRRRWMRLAAVLLILVIAAGIGFNPAYRFAKKWRSRQLARHAEAFIIQEKWTEAVAKARSAYQLQPDEPAAIRAVAHLESASGHPNTAIAFWQQLREFKAATPDDDRALAEDLLRAGAIAEAEQEINALLSKKPADPAYLRLAAKIFAAQRLFGRALGLAEEAQTADPASNEGRLLVSLLQVEIADEKKRARGMKSLFEQAHDRDKTGLDALTALASRRDLPPAQIPEVIALLKEHPSTTESHRLLALGLEYDAQPAARGALLDRTLAQYQSAEPAARRLFGIWLNTHREPERTLKLLPLADALTRKDLLLVHLDALASLKRWNDIVTILEGKAVPLDEVFSELFLARSAMELGQQTKAELHWTRAHIAAAPAPEQMEFLGNYAEKVGRLTDAESAYRSLASSATTARRAYEALLRLAEKRKDTPAMRDLLRDMHTRWPTDRSIDNDYAYLRLLTGVEIDAALQVAKQLIAQFPAALPHRTTLALAYCRAGDPAAALAVYAGLDVAWPRVAPSQRAVHVAVLGLNGRTTEARAEAAAIRPDDLRPEERALISKWRDP